jgi:2-polyprenyl-3-methyl-5-hydroxy-6-metoxy-1,4-benzoquinol methylase
MKVELLNASGECTAARDKAANQGKRVGILIVAYNAVTTLAQVFQRIRPEVWDNVHEVVVFDDASGDHTYELAVGYKMLQDVSKLTIIKNRQNLGYGGNQKAGYQYFIDKGFDVVVLLHGDAQYAPEILADMYYPIVSGEADAVFGSRMMKDYGGPIKGGMPFYKYLGNRILTTIENRALGMNLTEFHSGYRAYSVEALRRIDFSQMTNDFHFDTEIIIKLHHQGFRIAEIPIPTYYGNEICYVNGMRYAADVLHSVWRYKSTIHSGAAHPEFQEYFVHYPLKESRYSSHYFFYQFVGRHHDVLDLGCGEGFMAERLTTQGNRITGIDTLRVPQRSNAFVDYITADLTHGLGYATERLGGRKFDKILLMDVLEHLIAPEAVLRQCREFLKPGGNIVISVPNVANITVRLALLFGRFEYQPRGILDRTHLRFFTRTTARKLVRAAALEVTREEMTVMPIELKLGFSADNPMMKVLNRMLRLCTKLMPGLLGYQSVFVTRPRQL